MVTRCRAVVLWNRQEEAVDVMVSSCTSSAINTETAVIRGPVCGIDPPAELLYIGSVQSRSLMLPYTLHCRSL